MLIKLRRTPCPDVAIAPDGLPLVRVPEDDYGMLGADDPPEVSPPHRRFVHEYWIGAYPVTIAAYVRWVARFGYAADGGTSRGADELLGLLSRVHAGGGRYALGLTYFEATAYARALGLRLANEGEWEIAMRLGDPANRRERTVEVDRIVQRPSTVQLSPLGCAVLVSKFPEWTADRYRLYVVGVPSLRGWMPDPVERAAEMSVRGQASMRKPSPILRQAVKADDASGSVGFRCAVYAEAVQLCD